MKKVLVILALFCVCHSSHAQGPTEFSLSQDAVPIQTDTNDLYPEPQSCLNDVHFSLNDIVLRIKDPSLIQNDTVLIKDPSLTQSDTLPLTKDSSLILKDTVPAARDSLLILRDSSGSLIAQLPADTIPLRKDSAHMDSTARQIVAAVDSVRTDSLPKSKVKTPRGAIVRSAIIPGWGQAYNNRYWKIPIVYGALGTTAAVFSYNMSYYKKIRFAYTTLINKDSANFDNVAPELQPFIRNNDIASLRLNRNTFRKNIDYSVLFFLFFWGLNVLDATVDAHLKGFNVNDDLTLKIKPVLNSNAPGLSLVLDIHKGKPKSLFNSNNF